MKETLNVETRPEMEIIKGILDGNTAYFEILIRRNNPVLYKIGRSYGFGHEDTEDLMQETFLNAYAGLDKFQGRSAFRTWLVKIMIGNCYARRHKSGYLYEKADVIAESSVPMYTSKNTETNMIVMNRELGSVIEKALEKVPMEYRMVFSLREISGLNVSETAEALNISETNVRARLSRAKAMLRKEVEKTYAPEEIFEFNLIWCDRMVERVMKAIMG
ncbi:MAG: sigma-70 family RNA polymerase sigma factor [Chloroflexota bacterium]